MADNLELVMVLCFITAHISYNSTGLYPSLLSLIEGKLGSIFTCWVHKWENYSIYASKLALRLVYTSK